MIPLKVDIPLWQGSSINLPQWNPHTVNEAINGDFGGAFKNNKTVETVIIPSSVTTIEAGSV